MICIFRCGAASSQRIIPVSSEWFHPPAHASPNRQTGRAGAAATPAPCARSTGPWSTTKSSTGFGLMTWKGKAFTKTQFRCSNSRPRARHRGTGRRRRSCRPALGIRSRTNNCAKWVGVGAAGRGAVCCALLLLAVRRADDRRVSPQRAALSARPIIARRPPAASWLPCVPGRGLLFWRLPCAMGLGGSGAAA